jgi:hypothetical protein
MHRLSFRQKEAYARIAGVGIKTTLDIPEPTWPFSTS